jgi:hypothetical protein
MSVSDYARFGIFRMAAASFLPLSAWLNSRATLWGMPTRWANAGSCAAAAMNRRCLLEVLGIITLLNLPNTPEMLIAYRRLAVLCKTARYPHRNTHKPARNLSAILRFLI